MMGKKKIRCSTFRCRLWATHYPVIEFRVSDEIEREHELTPGGGCAPIRYGTPEPYCRACAEKIEWTDLVDDWQKVLDYFEATGKYPPDKDRTRLVWAPVGIKLEDRKNSAPPPHPEPWRN